MESQSFSDIPPTSPFVAYLEDSRQPMTSLIFSLPLFIVYHLGIWRIDSVSSQKWYNGADRVLAGFMHWLGISGPLVSLLLVALVFLFLQHWSGRSWRLRGGVFMLMCVECMFFCLPPFVLGEIVNRVLCSAGSSGNLPMYANIALALGAGGYEEFLFRMILLGLLLVVCRSVFGMKGFTLYAVAILLQAVLFSLFHYGPGSQESFELSIFAFRTIAGVYFAYLYQERGFGVAAGSHALYNVVAIVVTEMQGTG